ncbi:sodium:proton exchanger [Dactylosporangium vinaceum]|uniref:Sodium:proton exchanger n=1 Tax=Dactylosporangium vinaceum TaxID=53362 RepID=A0ABV5M241_9ACTN|nr:sodium:proton exchanger [Dactylosporangium vinaceum]UAB99403.1 sodium:proton exchanger [Dactylosporangium vinaceum]
MRRPPLSGLLALAATVPGVVVALGGADLPSPVAALVFGGAIIGAAFVLAWAAEAAQVDVSAGLAVAVLALIAVLPEYSVDFVFTWRGGEAAARYGADCAPPGGDGTPACSLALANMTGANRILVGIGWAVVVLIAWRRSKERGITLGRADAVPLAFLTLASLYCLVLPFKRTLTLWDTAILVAIFVAYSWRVSRAPAGEPDLVGPSAWVGGLGKVPRRATVIGLFAVSAVVILLAAEPFAQSLVDTGQQLGISEFLLVQWVAPLASEAPELLVAGLYAYRLHTTEALGALVSSKVNQWTLLVGTLPVVFAVSSRGLSGLPIEPAQRGELLLTAAQSLLAIALLLGLTLSLRAALALVGLFLVQFVLGAVLPPQWHDRELLALSGVYLLLAAVTVVRKRACLLPMLRDGLLTRYSDLGGDLRCTTTGGGRLRLRTRLKEVLPTGR